MESKNPYKIHINGNISTRKGESDLFNIIFICLKDDEIRYANELFKVKE